jgi:hypothetical protein
VYYQGDKKSKAVLKLDLFIPQDFSLLSILLGIYRGEAQAHEIFFILKKRPMETLMYKVGLL